LNALLASILMIQLSWHATCSKEQAEANVRVENLVLLVEDDASLRRSLEKFLDQAGYAFDSCSTASQALNIAQKVPPHVVILEYHLPDANGPSPHLYSELLETELGSNIRIVLKLAFPKKGGR